MQSLSSAAAAGGIFHGRQTDLYGFLDLEKASDQVPQKVIWWAMRKFGVVEWIETCSGNVQSYVWVGEGLSDEFEVNTRALYSVHCSSSSCLMLCHGRWEVSS